LKRLRFAIPVLAVLKSACVLRILDSRERGDEESTAVPNVCPRTNSGSPVQYLTALVQRLAIRHRGIDLYNRLAHYVSTEYNQSLVPPWRRVRSSLIS
jgi:hypothetical protein